MTAKLSNMRTTACGHDLAGSLLWILLFALFLFPPAAFVQASGSMATVYVDAENGDDSNSGESSEGAFQTLKHAVSQLAPSGTLHLLPGDSPFREQLHLPFGGTKDAPLVVEGNGAVIDLGRDITEGPWERDGELWVFQGEGRPHTRPFQASPICIDNQPQWVPHERDTATEPNGNVRVLEGGKFGVLFPPGKSPANSKMTLTSADGESGVFLNRGDHIVVKNLTVRYAGNDGFNVHGSGKGIVFENVSALMCGDQGISSHGTAEVSIDGAEVAFCGSRAGGIADVGECVTSYRNILLHNNRVGGMHLRGARHSVDQLVAFQNHSDKLPMPGPSVTVSNAAALNPEFQIVNTSGETDPSTLEILINKAKSAQPHIVLQVNSFRSRRELRCREH